MKKKVLIIGYFGYSDNQLDGQTMRTRSIYSLLNEESNFDVNYFDTQSFRQTKLNLVTLIKMLIKTDVVFCICAHRSLKYLFPLVFLLAKVARTKINYVSVGGWLYGFIKDKPIHKFMLRRVSGIYVQTTNLVSTLKNDNFNNVYLLNNFRNTEFSELSLNFNISKPLSLIFLARVHPTKGVDLLFELEKKIKSENIKNINIDIYGPIFSDYKDEFTSKILKSSISYCGVVEPDNIHKTMRNYDLLLFPTKYYTEGFPGTILDAYISGVPIVASNWLNAEEFIEHEKTGFIVPFNDDIQFIKVVLELIKNPQRLFNLRESISVKRHEYSAEKALEILSDAIRVSR
ncbi:glycosyltransferase family 4 protein [Pseudoalteromonas nigrifaciens]|uniref:glycosyltransferase family 4 protein n=1 Tax=Pseudoalteromonas nigrifaciens TaxID=28109 RepID=UPI001866A42F|nr:glycosyltransferase family 4 protein [Pseudoalteromonas nigrifaciens]